MSKPFSMPLLVDRYLGDTERLSLEQHGAYMLLLMAMWKNNGSIPDDDEENARMLRVGVRKWRSIKERLLPFLIVYGSGESRQITQKRLQEQWNKVADYRSRQRAKAALGGEGNKKRYQALKEAHGILRGLAPSQAPDEPGPEPQAKPQQSPPSKRIDNTTSESRSARGDDEIPHRLMTGLLAGEHGPPPIPRRAGGRN